MSLSAGLKTRATYFHAGSERCMRVRTIHVPSTPIQSGPFAAIVAAGLQARIL